MRYCDISCIRDFLSNAFFAAAAKVTLFSFVCEILGFHNHWIVWDVAVVAIDSIIFYIYIYIYIPISIFVCFYPHLTPLSLALNDSKLGVSETKKCRNNNNRYYRHAPIDPQIIRDSWFSNHDGNIELPEIVGNITGNTTYIKVSQFTTTSK